MSQHTLESAQGPSSIGLSAEDGAVEVIMKRKGFFKRPVILLLTLAALPGVMCVLIDGGYVAGAKETRDQKKWKWSRGKADVALKIEGDTLLVSLCSDKEVKGALVLTYLKQNPIVIPKNFQINKVVSVRSSFPLRFGEHRSWCYRLEVFEEKEGYDGMLLPVGEVLIKPSSGVPTENSVRDKK